MWSSEMTSMGLALSTVASFPSLPPQLLWKLKCYIIVIVLLLCVCTKFLYFARIHHIWSLIRNMWKYSRRKKYMTLQSQCVIKTGGTRGLLTGPGVLWGKDPLSGEGCPVVRLLTICLQTPTGSAGAVCRRCRGWGWGGTENKGSQPPISPPHHTALKKTKCLFRLQKMFCE
jgi:hypothetical protein